MIELNHLFNHSKLEFCATNVYSSSDTLSTYTKQKITEGALQTLTIHLAAAVPPTVSSC